MKFDRTKTLNQLKPSNVRFGAIPMIESSLIETCKRLRDKPIKDFTFEDVRILVGQGINVEYLVPIAIEYLELSPIASGNYYQGDLLMNLINGTPFDFWEKNHEYTSRLIDIINHIEKIIPKMTEIDRETIEEALSEVSFIIERIKGI